MIDLTLAAYVALLAIVVRTGFAFYKKYFQDAKPELFNGIFIITGSVAYLLSMVFYRMAIIVVTPPMMDLEYLVAAFALPYFANDLFNRIIYAGAKSIKIADIPVADLRLALLQILKDAGVDLDKLKAKDETQPPPP